MQDDVSQRLRALFPADWWIESQEFNLVHKTVLGLNPLVLDDLLASVPEVTINSGDAKGRTPLWWTAHRGDYPAMLSLLRHNADVSKPSNAGWSVLSTAIWSRSQQCVRLLLQPSSDLSQRSSDGWLPLHSAAFLGLDHDIIRATIPPGIDVNVPTVGNAESTALMLAAQRNYHHACAYLLSLGANPDAVNNLGETALNYAIEYNSQAVMRLLWQDTNIRLTTKAGETLLHCAAQHSDFKTLEVLYELDMHGICTQDTVVGESPAQILLNVVGLTALEIGERRDDVSPEWLAMFHKLLHKIENPGDSLHTSVTAREEEQFHDSLEFQDP